MKNIATIACLLFISLSCQNLSAQVYRQVCENGVCQLVEVAPVRKAVSTIVDSVSETPPVPVMHSVVESVTVKTGSVANRVYTTVRKPVTRACCFVKKVASRFRIFRR